MKKFKDLIFNQHEAWEGLQAVMFFENGYGISVIRFKIDNICYGSYTDNETEWEIAILYGNNEKFGITYNTPITDDVIGHLTDDEVTDIMKRIQELPSEEEIREPIQNALYATGSFFTDECTELAIGILEYLHDAGFNVVRQ